MHQGYEEIVEVCKEAIEGVSRKKMYLDILYETSMLTQVYKSRSEEGFVLNPELGGIVVRAFKGGQWYEYGVQQVAEVKAVVERLQRIPSRSKKQADLQEFEGWSLNEEITVEKSAVEIPIEAKIAKIRELFSEIQKADKRVINPIVRYYDTSVEHIFLNNEGCVLRQKIPRIRIFLQPIVKEGAQMAFDYFSESGEVGFELMEGISREDVEQTVKNSTDLLASEKAPSGMLPVILDSDMAGIIAHESFGHGLEADQILRGRSYLEQYINKPVASEVCMISDSPVETRNIGSYFFDDEGIRAKKTILVEGGILKKLLHDRYTASAMNLAPGGNGRRESYAHKLHVRMTNTFFEAGDWNLEEMIEEIKYGIMAVRGYFGMEDPLGGGMQVTSKKGYLIENGEQTKLLDAITLSGPVLDVLKSIDAVGKGPVKYHGGTCGKGHEDYVPVTTGGPYIRAQKVVVSPG